MKLLRFYFETSYYELTYFHNRIQLQKFLFQVSILTCCYIVHVSMLSTTNVLVQHFRDQGSLCIFIMISMTLCPLSLKVLRYCFNISYDI